MIEAPSGARDAVPHPTSQTPHHTSKIRESRHINMVSFLSDE